MTIVDRNKTSQEESGNEKVRIVGVQEYCNVRTGPGTGYDVAGRAYLGDAIELLEWDATETWCKVIYGNGQYLGWIHRDFLGI